MAPPASPTEYLVTLPALLPPPLPSVVLSHPTIESKSAVPSEDISDVALTAIKSPDVLLNPYTLSTAPLSTLSVIPDVLKEKNDL